MIRQKKIVEVRIHELNGSNQVRIEIEFEDLCDKDFMGQTVMTLKYKKRFHIGMQCKYLWLNQNETFNTYFS